MHVILYKEQTEILNTLIYAQISDLYALFHNW